MSAAAPAEEGRIEREPSSPVRTALRYYWIVTVSGAVVMALEILSIRILAPTFGNSVYTWGSIISVFLAAMALGYVVGGRLADRSSSLVPLGQVLLLAGFFQTLLLAGALPMAEALGRFTAGSPFGPLLASAALFAPGIVGLATVSPFVLRIAARELTGLGQLAGRLYALGTAGSMTGALACTFVLIPFFELDTILVLLLSLTTLTALAALERSLWRSPLTLGLSGLLVLSVLLSLPGLGAGSSAAVVRRITPYQTLELRETDDKRTLLSDGSLHSSVVLATGEPGLQYAKYSIAPLLFREEYREALVLGLGGGSIGNYLQRGLPRLVVESVDVDPAILEMAERYMGFERSDLNQVHLQDARLFLSRTDRTWDLIVSDTYIGLSIPFHLTTREFFTLVRQRLSADGVLLVNLASGTEHPFARAIFATVAAVFPQVYVFDVPLAGNILVVGTQDSHRLSSEQLAERAGEIDRRVIYRPSLAEVAVTLQRIDLDLGPEDILVDRHAPVDRLLHLGRSAGAR